MIETARAHAAATKGHLGGNFRMEAEEDPLRREGNARKAGAAVAEGFSDPYPADAPQASREVVRKMEAADARGEPGTVPCKVALPHGLKRSGSARIAASSRTNRAASASAAGDHADTSTFTPPRSRKRFRLSRFPSLPPRRGEEKPDGDRRASGLVRYRVSLSRRSSHGKERTRMPPSTRRPQVYFARSLARSIAA